MFENGEGRPRSCSEPSMKHSMNNQWQIQWTIRWRRGGMGDRKDPKGVFLKCFRYPGNMVGVCQEKEKAFPSLARAVVRTYRSWARWMRSSLLEDSDNLRNFCERSVGEELEWLDEVGCSISVCAGARIPRCRQPSRLRPRLACDAGAGDTKCYAVSERCWIDLR